MPHTTHRIVAGNLHFGEALSDTPSMDLMFGPPAEPHHGTTPTVVAFQEVWPSSREEARSITERFEYQAVEPRTSLDLFAAVKRGVAIRKEGEHIMRGRRLDLLKTLTRRLLRRDAGIHAFTADPVDSRWQLQILNSHPVPPPLQLITRQEIRDTHKVLAEHYSTPSDGIINVLVRDGNHFRKPYKWDTARLHALGYNALIPEGTPTCIIKDTHPIASKIMRFCGIPDPQLDSAYVAIPESYNLIHCADAESTQALGPKDIGYYLTLGRIASDHLAYSISLHLPE